MTAGVAEIADVALQHDGAAALLVDEIYQGLTYGAESAIMPPTGAVAADDVFVGEYFEVLRH